MIRWTGKRGVSTMIFIVMGSRVMKQNTVGGWLVRTETILNHHNMVVSIKGILNPRAQARMAWTMSPKLVS